MPEQRKQVSHGLRLTLRNYPAILWVYAFNLGLAMLFSLRNYSQFNDVIQFNDVLSHSLASERLTNAFDLGTALGVLTRIGDNAPRIGRTPYLGLPIYALLYFIVVPGALFCFQTGTPAGVANLLGQGLKHFWRFVRITLLAGVVALVILGPLFALNSLWERHVDLHKVGEAGFISQAAALILILIVGMIIRLYFDLVEVYTVQLGLQPKPDYRIRRALLPALRTLGRGFAENAIVFLFLTLLGSAVMAVAGRSAILSLAQPRAWPTFLFAQIGFLALLVTRFWQRGAQTTLAMNFPIEVVMSQTTEPLNPNETDPLPPPEPIAPALDEPDPGVFHHDPQGLPQQ